MVGQDSQPQKLTMSSTKKEMLEAYNTLVKQLKEQREAEMKPAEKIEEKQSQEAIAVADALSTEGIGKEIGALKSEIGKMLVELSDKLEAEAGRYAQIKKAVSVREKELHEIYEIEKSASTLAALLEVQEHKRKQFEDEMAQRKELLQSEIETARDEWEKEGEAHEAEVRERNAAEKKRREREAEEYKYQFEREQQLAREQFDYEKAKLEREVQLKKDEMEKDLAEREKAVAERENELKDLRAKVEALSKEQETAVARAVEATTQRLTQDATNREQLLQKEFEGQRNVLNSRIEALQQTVKEQGAQIAKLSAQLEKSYGQVQDIAVKAIEGSANVKAFVSQAQPAAEAPRRSGQGES